MCIAILCVCVFFLCFLYDFVVVICISVRAHIIRFCEDVKVESDLEMCLCVSVKCIHLLHNR